MAFLGSFGLRVAASKTCDTTSGSLMSTGVSSLLSPEVITGIFVVVSGMLTSASKWESLPLFSSITSGIASVLVAGLIAISDGLVAVSGSLVVVSDSLVVVANSLVVVSGSLVVDSGSLVLVSGSLVVVSVSLVAVSGSLVVVSVSLVVVSVSLVVVSVSLVVVSGSLVVVSGSLVVVSGSLMAMLGNFTAMSGSLVPAEPKEDPTGTRFESTTGFTPPLTKMGGWAGIVTGCLE